MSKWRKQTNAPLNTGREISGEEFEDSVSTRSPDSGSATDATSEEICSFTLDWRTTWGLTGFLGLSYWIKLELLSGKYGNTSVFYANLTVQVCLHARSRYQARVNETTALHRPWD
jgi:hypothetical protein